MNWKKLEAIFFDFDGVFTDNCVTIDENGIESVRCSRSDGIGLKKIRSLGIDSFIMSTEKNKVVSKRAEKLKIKCFQGIDDKKEKLISEIKKRNISIENVAFMGNDINDLEVMKIVGFPICVNDAYPEIKSISHIITEKKGGYGAVREICDRIYNSWND